MTAKSARESILVAAEAIVAEKGASFMTLDAVAARAKVNKGGLIYHFGTKEALLTALMDRFSRRISSYREKLRDNLPESKARDLIAYITSHAEFCMETRRMGSGLMAAALRAPELIKPSQDSWSKALLEILGQTKRPEQFAILLMAADCIWLLDLLGMQLFPEKMLDQIKARICELAYEWTEEGEAQDKASPAKTKQEILKNSKPKKKKGTL